MAACERRYVFMWHSGLSNTACYILKVKSLAGFISYAVCERFAAGEKNTFFSALESLKTIVRFLSSSPGEKKGAQEADGWLKSGGGHPRGQIPSRWDHFLQLVISGKTHSLGSQLHKNIYKLDFIMNVYWNYETKRCEWQGSICQLWMLGGRCWEEVTHIRGPALSRWKPSPEGTEVFLLSPSLLKFLEESSCSTTPCINMKSTWNYDKSNRAMYLRQTQTIMPQPFFIVLRSRVRALKTECGELRSLKKCYKGISHWLPMNTRARQKWSQTIRWHAGTAAT